MAHCLSISIKPFHENQAHNQQRHSQQVYQQGQALLSIAGYQRISRIKIPFRQVRRGFSGQGSQNDEDLLLAVGEGPLFAPANPTKFSARDHPDLVRGKKFALLVGSTSLDQSLNHVIDRLSKAADINVIFTGKTSFRPILKDPSGKGKRDALTNATVLEILDPLKRPSVEDLQGSDLLVVDVQDIGIRYFNYVTLLAQFLDLARAAKIPILVLDRPNPIGANCVSGPVLQVDFRSQYGVYPIPLVYGMTIGELALLFNRNFGLGAQLTDRRRYGGILPGNVLPRHGSPLAPPV